MCCEVALFGIWRREGKSLNFCALTALLLTVIFFEARAAPLAAKYTNIFSFSVKLSKLKLFFLSNEEICRYKRLGDCRSRELAKSLIYARIMHR